MKRYLNNLKTTEGRKTILINLHHTISILTNLLPAIKDSKTRPLASVDFTAAFYDLFIVCQSGLKSEETRTVSDFLEVSAPQLQPQMRYLDYQLVNRIELLLNKSFMGEEWLMLCRLRSTLESLKQLYGPYLTMADLVPEDEELDNQIRTKAESEAFQSPLETPINFPPSHWWWGLE